MEEALTFLGTAGARIMVANQILACGGLWLSQQTGVRVVAARDGMKFDLLRLNN